MYYFYQYDVAAVLLILTMLAIYALKRTFISRSNRIFLLIILVDLFTAIFDIASVFVIDSPKSYPLWLANFICLGYLFFYNMMSVSFFMYVDSRAKIPQMKKLSGILVAVVTAFYLVVIGTSPWTHLVAYFDENMVYRHGFMMNILYVIPFLFFASEIAMFVVAKKRFSKYQLLSCGALIIGMSVSVVITIIDDRLLVGPLVMAVIMVFIYMAFENPAYYTYRDTQCYNDHAFNSLIGHYQKEKKKFSLVCAHISDYEEFQQNYNYASLNLFNVKVAELLYAKFKKSIFCMADGKYVIVVEAGAKGVDKYIGEIHQVFEHNVNFQNESVKVNVAVYPITDIDSKFSVADITTIVNYRLNMGNSDLTSYQLLEHLSATKMKEASIVKAIKRAIDNESFQVYYQPIYHVQSGKFKSAEALIRLFDEEIGFVNPEELIVTAEKVGYINRVGDIVFEKVCKFISENEIRKLGVEYIEINVSPIQCKRASIPYEYVKVMENYGVKSNQLNFEITETAEVQDEKIITQNILDFFLKGISFSIDDYGSGFASADYLMKLPVEIVKIDKSILWGAMKNNQAMIILKNTIGMIKALGKRIVVEGIETEEMARILKELGVDYNQGYFYSKPLPGNEYIKFISEKNFANSI